MCEMLSRRQCIPILYTRGTHYEVGYDVGYNFASVIQNFLKSYEVLHQEFLPAYFSPQGQKAYAATLASVTANFPQYIDELRGTADGAKVPFHELFLLHMDNIILQDAHNSDIGQQQPTGCSSICLNRDGQQILGHTEDALAETLNHFYFVSAHIISDKPQGRWKIKEEKFTSLCYAGHLPGYTMNYNHHGLVFSINTITAKNLKAGSTPRHILTRALLAAENFAQAKEILSDRGCGVGDACSVNLTFVKQDGEPVFHNIEIAPMENEHETELSIVQISKGEHNTHTNSFLRIGHKQANYEMLKSSDARLETFKMREAPKTKEDVIEMLSDNSNIEYPVFRDHGFVRTIAVGIFDCIEKTWTLYSDNPKNNAPLVVLPLDLK